MQWTKIERAIAPVVPVVSLAEAKDHLRVEHTADDAYIESLIATAMAAIDGPNGIGIAMVGQAWTGTLDSRFPAEIVLPLYPVTAVTQIAYIDPDGQEQTLDAADYRLISGNPAMVVPAMGASWPTTYRGLAVITVTFVAGFGLTAADVPADLRHAVLLMVGHLYDHREAVGSAKHEMPLGYRSMIEHWRVGRFG